MVKGELFDCVGSYEEVFVVYDEVMWGVENDFELVVEIYIVKLDVMVLLEWFDDVVVMFDWVVFNKLIFDYFKSDLMI